MINELGPCREVSVGVQVLNAALNAITIVIVAWLANRRRMADEREKRANGDGAGHV